MSENYQSISPLKLSDPPKQESSHYENQKEEIAQTHSSPGVEIINTISETESLNQNTCSYLNGNRTSIGSDACDGIQPPESESIDHSMKPSKIPVLRLKNVQGLNLSDSLENHVDNLNANKIHKSSNVSSLAASPISRKKYRSQVSNQSRQLDQSKGSQNGILSNEDALSDNLNLSEDANSVNMDVKSDQKIYDISFNNSYGNETVLSPKNVNCIQNETNSGRSTPTWTNSKPTNINSLNSERKPRFKWMFGPHRNASVVSFLILLIEFYIFECVLNFMRKIIISVAGTSEEKSRIGVQYRWWGCRS